MAQKKYVSLSKLSTFLENLKNIFAKTEHSHTVSDVTDLQDELSNYYTKVDIDDLELITTNDIDTICGTTIQIAREVTF